VLEDNGRLMIQEFWPSPTRLEPQFMTTCGWNKKTLKPGDAAGRERRP
jgi:hypothetical protein